MAWLALLFSLVSASWAKEPESFCVVWVPGAVESLGSSRTFFISWDEMFSGWQEEFLRQGVSCQKKLKLPLDATIEERAWVIKESLRSWKEGAGKPWILIAQSQGGLDVRYAVKSLQLSGVRGILTLGTPHHGSDVARWALDHRERGSWLATLVKLFGYDMRALRSLSELAPGFVDSRKDYFLAAHEPCTAWAELKGGERGWRERAALTLGRIVGMPQVGGDGLVSSSDQAWGWRLGSYELSHLTSVNAQRYGHVERERLWKDALSWARGLLRPAAPRCMP